MSQGRKSDSQGRQPDQTGSWQTSQMLRREAEKVIDPLAQYRGYPELRDALPPLSPAAELLCAAYVGNVGKPADGSGADSVEARSRELTRRVTSAVFSPKASPADSLRLADRAATAGILGAAGAGGAYLLARLLAPDAPRGVAAGLAAAGGMGGLGLGWRNPMPLGLG